MRWRVLAGLGLSISVIAVVFFVWAIWLYQSGRQLAEAVLTQNEADARKLIEQIEWGWRPAEWIIGQLPATQTLLPIKAASEVMGNLGVLLGASNPRSYIVLLQNNMELRPTGGFMGSFAIINFDKGVLTGIRVEDIYVPDGQIKGYVPEPPAIKKYLFNNNHPGWRLRDGNWHPDFVESAKAIEWFLREGGIEPPDGFGAITLSPIVDLLRQIGPIKLVDYGGLTIDADNFYEQTQDHAESDFFPGSTQKRDFLSSLSKQLLFKVTHEPKLAVNLLPVMWQALIHKELLVFIPDVTGESWRKLGWDGSIRSSKSDYLMINEANLGSNKANCCIVRSVTDAIQVVDDGVAHELTISYRNENPSVPQPPYFWGGGYKNYVRIIVPANSRLTGVFINDQSIENSLIDEEVWGDKKSWGFLVLIEGGEAAKVVVSYQVKLSFKNYSLLFQKQTGIKEWPVEIILGNKTIKQKVNTDWVFISHSFL